MGNGREGRWRWRKFPRNFLNRFLVLVLVLVFFLVLVLIFLLVLIFSPASSPLPKCTRHFPKPPAPRRHRRLLTRRERKCTRSRRRVPFIRLLGILCPIATRNHGLLIGYNGLLLPYTLHDACADKSPQGTRTPEAQETVIRCA